MKGFFLVFAVVGIVGAAGREPYAQTPQIPYVAEVTGDRLRIRARASMKSEAVGVLDKGERIIVRGVDGEWSKIEPASDCRAWIHRDYVKEGEVQGDAVRIRAGPGVAYSILRKMDRGESVEAVGEKGEWIEIVPPAGAYFWAHGDYLTPLCRLEEYAALVTEEERRRDLLAEAKHIEEMELILHPEKPDAKSIIAAYRKILDEAPSSPEGKVAAAKVDVYLERMRGKETPVVRKMAPPPAKVTPVARKMAPPPEVAVYTEEPSRERPRVLSACEGRLARRRDGQLYIKRGWLFGKAVCLLEDAPKSLRDSLGKRVVVKGEIVGSTRSGIPHLRVWKAEPVGR